MSDKIQVIIHSENKEIYEGKPIFNCTDGQAIHTYDRPQWLTEKEITHLVNNGFNVERLS